METPVGNDPRILGLLYFAITASLVTGMRLIIRYSQRRLLEAGIGRRPSIIVGDSAKAKDLAQKVEHYPRLGYQIVGYVSPNGAITSPHESFHIASRIGTASEKEIRHLGSLTDIEKLAS